MWNLEQGVENASQFSHQGDRVEGGATMAAAGLGGVLYKMMKSLGYIEAEGSRR